MMDDAIGALAIICIFGLPFIAWIAIRGMAHRERMEMIRNGMMPQNDFRTSGAGYARRQEAPPPPPASRRGCGEAHDPQATLRKGVVVTAVGIALTIGLSFIGTVADPPHYTFGPWLLGGLIPLFVGLAQIVSALMSGATMGVPQGNPYAGYPGPGPAPGPQAAPSQHFDGPYTYRPGMTQELQPPSGPPDRT
jgi:hypothetical protein